MGLGFLRFTKRAVKGGKEAAKKIAETTAKAAEKTTKYIAYEQKIARPKRQKQPQRIYHGRGSVDGLRSVDGMFFKDPAFGTPLKKRKENYDFLG